MILRLRTNAYAGELLSILALASALVDHLASCQSPALDDAALPAAGWLLRHLHAQIEELLGNTTQSERRQLAAAVTNDIQFDRKIDSRSFRFQYPELPAHVQRHSRPLFTAFYDILCRPGFPPAATGEHALDRRLIERGFFERNEGIRACPACMEAEIAPAADGAPITSDCDHFLPRFRYGPLAIHPQNLVFTCIPCNERRKGSRDPLSGSGPSHDRRGRRTAAGALRRSYLPYRRAAQSELRIEFAPEGVTLTADTELERERVANLDCLYGLSRVWSDVLPRAEREMFEELEGPPTRKAVEAVLRSTEDRGRGAPERLKHGVFLRSRYAAHLRDGQLDVLTKEWQRKSAELRSSAALYARQPPRQREPERP
jgi:hypothetical protein